MYGKQIGNTALKCLSSENTNIKPLYNKNVEDKKASNTSF